MTKNKKRTTTKVIFIFIILFSIIGIFILSFTHDRENYSEFEKIGYYKNGKIRIRSYYTSTMDFEKIKNHARTMPWTEGGVTHIYYFDDKENTPNVSHLGVKFSPRFKKSCIASYNKLTHNEENFEKYPFKN